MDNSQLIGKLNRIKLLAEECLRDLSVISRQQKTSILTKSLKTDIDASKDFSLPIRTFIKKYASKLSGPKKFTLLVARLVTGDTQRKIPLTEIEKQWNSMTSLLGGMRFNRFFSQQARDNGWVETPGRGIYSLRSTWVEIFND